MRQKFTRQDMSVNITVSFGVVSYQENIKEVKETLAQASLMRTLLQAIHSYTCWRIMLFLSSAANTILQFFNSMGQMFSLFTLSVSEHEFPTLMGRK